MPDYDINNGEMRKPNKNIVKYFYIATMYYGFVIFGIVNTIYGPTFQDLKEVFDTDVQGLSYGNVIQAVTYGGGALAG